MTLPIYKLGIDISLYQPHINWPALKTPFIPLPGLQARPAEFAIIKASEDMYHDPLCQAHAVNASNADVPFGYYHFAGTHIDPTQAAKLFVTPAIAPTMFQKMGFPDYWLDIEKNKAHLSPQGIVDWCEAFFKGTGLAPERFGIYTGSFWNDMGYVPHSLGRFKLWFASYTRENQIRLPNGWKTWDIWQFGVEVHPAVGGSVDCNFIK